MYVADEGQNAFRIHKNSEFPSNVRRIRKIGSTINALAFTKQNPISQTNVWSYGEANTIHMRRIYLDLLKLCINGHNGIINVEITF